MSKINRDLLVVFNVFGEKTDEEGHIGEHIRALESIFWHIDKHKLQNSVRVVVSACLISDNMSQRLRDHFKDRLDIIRYNTPLNPPENAPPWGKVGRWPCQVTFNKTCLVSEERFNEHYNGYFYISSGLILPQIEDLFPRIIEKNNSGEYGIIQLQVDVDQGYHWLGHGEGWNVIDFSKDYYVPIGNNCNWHIGVMNRSLLDFYGMPQSDIHGVCGLESALSYISYAIRKKYVLLGNSICTHVPQAEHAYKMVDRIKNMPMIDCGRLWARTNEHFLEDHEGVESGLGYFPGKQCNNAGDKWFGFDGVLAHKQDKYDENHLSNDIRCRDAVKRQYFTNIDDLDYSRIEYFLEKNSIDVNPNGYNWPLINDNITMSDKRALSDFILSTNRFTNGPQVQKFEKSWSEWLGCKYSVMVGSGAAANYITTSIVRELKGKTGEIIVPPIGWVSDISSVINTGFKPVFVDVDVHTMAITYENIKKAINKNTKAIVLVHALGFNGINEKIIQLAKEHDLVLIEDCCESHGATYNGKRVGTYGDMSCFSFYFGHHMTTIEGGMVCTNDEHIYQLARMFRSHGMTREASEEIQKKYASPELNPLFTFAVPGYNMRSTELNAVLGLEQIKRLDDNINKRVENLNLWLDSLDSEIYFTGFTREGQSNYALPLLLFIDRVSKQKMQDICKILSEEKVEYRLGTAGGGNQVRQPYLKNYDFDVVGTLETSDYIHEYGLYIGNHPGLTRVQIINLCERLNNV